MTNIATPIDRTTAAEAAEFERCTAQVFDSRRDEDEVPWCWAMPTQQPTKPPQNLSGTGAASGGLPMRH